MCTYYALRDSKLRGRRQTSKEFIQKKPKAKYGEMLNNDIYFLIVDYYGTIYSFNSCKGQCHEIFDTFSLHKKTSPGPHMNRQKRFFKTFSFHVDIGEKTTVCVVNYYTFWRPLTLKEHQAKKST